MNKLKRNLFLVLTISLTILTSLFTLIADKFNYDINDTVMAEKRPKLIKQATVFITKEGYSPTDLLIEKGTEVTWVNLDTISHQIGLGLHLEEHSEFPVVKENTSFSYIFENQEVFLYHDEANPLETSGTIKVY